MTLFKVLPGERLCGLVGISSLAETLCSFNKFWCWLAWKSGVACESMPWCLNKHWPLFITKTPQWKYSAQSFTTELLTVATSIIYIQSCPLLMPVSKFCWLCLALFLCVFTGVWLCFICCPLQGGSYLQPTHEPVNPKPVLLNLDPKKLFLTSVWAGQWHYTLDRWSCRFINSSSPFCWKCSVKDLIPHSI